MDETTDCSSTKQCAINIIYYDRDKNKVATQFFDMVEMASGTAQDLHRCIKDCLKRNGIPLANVVGFSADTTNVMFGEQNSVFTLLKRDLPEIACIKCSCHMIHLAASKACLKLPRSLEDLLRNLGAHFNRSYLRQEKFKDFQEFFQTEIHKILSPAVTRWLSLKACVDRVLEQYPALKAYLRETAFEGHSKTVDDMLQTIENKFMEVYLEFMSYALGLLTDFNTLFQKETPLLHKLKPEVERLLKHLCSNYMDIAYVKNIDILKAEHANPRKFVEIEKMYLGIQAHQSLDEMKADINVPQQDVERVFSTLNICKSNHRNSLKTETIVALMVTKEGIKEEGGCVMFNPNREMLRANIWSK